MTEFGTWLRAERERQGLSRADLGDAAGLTASAVGQIERGTIKRPPMHRLRGFSRALGITLTILTTFFVAPLSAKPINYESAQLFFTNVIQARHVAMFSGGKDSTCMTDLMHCLGMPIDCVLCADLGAEWPQMYTHWHKFEELTGLHVTIVRHPLGDFRHLFQDYQLRKGKRVGQHGYGWCGRVRWGTERKKQAIRAALRDLFPGDHIIEYHGVSFDEPHRFGKCRDGRDIRRPLVDWQITGPQALEWCYAQDYDWGGLYQHLDRVSCWCCENKNLRELAWMREHHPAMWAELRRMDRLSSHPFKGIGLPAVEAKLAT